VKFAAIQADGTALWPDRFDRQTLEDIRAEWESKGRSYMFDTLYQQNPRSNPESCAWKDEYFANVFRNRPPEFASTFKVLACDPSHGANSNSGDFTAIADLDLVNGYGPGRTLWCNMFLRRMDWYEAATAFAQAIIERKPRAAIIETAAGQDPIRAEVQRQLDAANCIVPLHGFDPLCAQKVPAIEEALTQWLHLGRIYFDDNLGGNLCVNQMKEFPSGANDDGPDAIRMGLALIGELLG
jgi:phospholipid N-methyltransferase